MWPFIAMAVSAAMSAGGAHASAKAQKLNLKSQAAMDEINAGIARQQAEGAFIQGRHQIMQNTMQTGQMMGSQRASLASRGIDIGYGSAAEIRAGTAAMREIDYNTLSANALRAAWGYKTQVTDLENRALMGIANSNAISPGKAAFGSLLTDAAKSYGMYSMMGGGSGNTTTAQPSGTPADWGASNFMGSGTPWYQSAYGSMSNLMNKW